MAFRRRRFAPIHSIATQPLVAISQPSVKLSVGDPMPRIMLREASEGQFDSDIRGPRVRPGSIGSALRRRRRFSRCLATALANLRNRSAGADAGAVRSTDGNPTWLLDPAGELSRTFDATGPLAVVVNAWGKVAARLSTPLVNAVETVARRLYNGSTPSVVRAQALVLLLERVVEPTLCRALMDHWRRGEKLADGVASTLSANLADRDVKRRQDVPLDDAMLYMQLQSCLLRRVMPAVLQAFQSRIVQIEAPRIGCYDASSGG